MTATASEAMCVSLVPGAASNFNQNVSSMKTALVMLPALSERAERVVAQIIQIVPKSKSVSMVAVRRSVGPTVARTPIVKMAFGALISGAVSMVSFAWVRQTARD